MNTRDKERDLLWIRAITSAGMDTTQLYQILKKFNRIRPDKEKKVHSFHGETPEEVQDPDEEKFLLARPISESLS